MDRDTCKDNMDPATEIVTLIDYRDNVIGAVPRAQVRNEGLLHRVTYLLVFSSDGKILVQTRTGEKDVYPGYLDFAAGGVVLEGESYEQSAQRELEEELGIDVPLEPCFSLYIEDRSTKVANNNWGRVFSCICDGPFSLQKEEVAAVEFMAIEKAFLIDPVRVTPDTRLALLAYI